MKLNYRPEIDGLRAIAVISVIIYHAKINFFNYSLLEGGFLGVDIFFVISGYLITSIILKELLSENNFSFLNFYKRRFRRIMPVLITVISTTFVFSWFILVPTTFVEFAKSVQYSFLFSTNIFFHFSGIEYISQDGLLKPLLHTWSLSVEEQYYIIFPILLFFIYKNCKNYLILVLIILFFLSLLVANNLSYSSKSFNFYMLHTRGWELLAGSFLAYLEIGKKMKSKNIIISNFLSFSGLFLIIFSIIFFDEETRHPSFFTILPILGVSLIIFYTDKANIVGKVLASKLLVGIGLISYSLYLWHYPVFAFARLSEYFNDNLHKIFFLSIVVVLSVLSYFVIEKPCRNRNIKFRKIFFSFLTLSILLLLISNVVINKEGFHKRAKYVGNIGLKLENYLLDPYHYVVNHFFTFGKNYAPDNFKNAPSANVRMLVVGNSAGQNMFHALYSNKNLFTGYTFNLISSKIRVNKQNYSTNCFNKFLSNKDYSCDEFDFTQNILVQLNISDTIFLASRWDQGEGNLTDLISNLENTIQILKKKNKKIIIAGMPVLLKLTTLSSLNPLDYFVYQNGRMPTNYELLKLEEKIFDDLRDDEKFKQRRKINLGLSNLANKFSLQFLNPEDYQCEKVKKKCTLLTSDKDRIYIDDVHTTNEGSSYFGKKIHDIDWFKNK